MKHFRNVWVMMGLLSVILISLGFLVSSGKAMAYFKLLVRQRNIVRGVESVDKAFLSISSYLEDVASKSASVQYEALMSKMERKNAPLSEAELSKEYRREYCNSIRELIGDSAENIISNIENVIPEEDRRVLSFDDSVSPILIISESPEGRIESLELCNIALIFDDGINGPIREEKSYEFMFPAPVFYEGNEELFKYCMISGKGIYMTGETSSVVGNIYCGEHPVEECRDAEALYGEMGKYGGLNILSTQVGIMSDMIISKGDVNINGSFVIVSPCDKKKVSGYANSVNVIEGFSHKSQFTIDGELVETEEADDDVLKDYRKEIAQIIKATSQLENISFFYDSINDSECTCPYRKIISAQDVEISDDFSGVIITEQNVIVDANCSVEGIIICGDRIYLRGNNTIVANTEVARDILRYESDKRSVVELSIDDNKDVTREFRQPERYIQDYIEGLIQSGMNPPEYYVVSK